MTASQSLNLYHIALNHFKNEADASSFVKEIEIVVDTKFADKADVLATKQDIAEAKVDIIRWQVGIAIAVVGIIITLMELL